MLLCVCVTVVSMLLCVCDSQHPRSQEDWAHLLRQQRSLHQDEVSKWREILYTTVQLLDQVPLREWGSGLADVCVCVGGGSGTQRVQWKSSTFLCIFWMTVCVCVCVRACVRACVCVTERGEQQRNASAKTSFTMEKCHQSV